MGNIRIENKTRFLSLWLLAILLGGCKEEWVQNKPIAEKHDPDHLEGDYRPHDSIEKLLLDFNPLDHGFKESLREPNWVSGDSAFHMRGDDIVIGTIIKEKAYAFPWWIMKNHHIANLIIEDIPVVVTLCEMCSGANVFKREVGGQVLDFFQRGLYKSSWFMEDYETGSYFLPFEGIGFHGPLQDSVLEFIETYQTTWEVWFEANPETQVLFDSQDKRKGHGSREFPGRTFTEELFYSTKLEELSDRLPKNELVLGVSLDDAHKAYSFKMLEKNGLVTEDVLKGGNAIVIFHKPSSIYTGVFSPVLQDEILRFSEVDGNIKDTKTGSIWNYNGRCIAGVYKGFKLEPIFSAIKEWYGWHSYHPDTDVF